MSVKNRLPTSASAARGDVRLIKSPRVLVHVLLSRLLEKGEGGIADTDLLLDLKVDALDLVLVAIKLEEIEPNSGPFPLPALAHTATVGDLVELVETWWWGDASRTLRSRFM